VKRRELLLAVAGLAAVPSAASAAETEGDVLLDLIRREQGAVKAYGAVLEALGSGAPSELVAVRGHDADHADALATELAAVGLARPPAGRPAGAAATLAAATARPQAIEAALALEDELVAAYRAALAGLPDTKIAMTAATILASHAQHRLILGLATGRPAS
jgi:hypothetical protein